MFKMSIGLNRIVILKKTRDLRKEKGNLPDPKDLKKKAKSSMHKAMTIRKVTNPQNDPIKDLLGKLLFLSMLPSSLTTELRAAGLNLPQGSHLRDRESSRSKSRARIRRSPRRESLSNKATRNRRRTSSLSRRDRESQQSTTRRGSLRRLRSEERQVCMNILHSKQRRRKHNSRKLT